MTSALTLTQGVSTGYAWPIVDPAGTPADLTGYTARCQVRERDGVSSALLATLTAAVVGSSVTVSWTDTESRAWTWQYGYMDVVLRDADGDGRTIVWQGTVKVDPVVTDRG